MWIGMFLNASECTGMYTCVAEDTQNVLQKCFDRIAFTFHFNPLYMLYFIYFICSCMHLKEKTAPYLNQCEEM